MFVSRNCKHCRNKVLKRRLNLRRTINQRPEASHWVHPIFWKYSTCGCFFSFGKLWTSDIPVTGVWKTKSNFLASTGHISFRLEMRLKNLHWNSKCHWTNCMEINWKCNYKRNSKHISTINGTQNINDVGFEFMLNCNFLLSL